MGKVSDAVAWIRAIAADNSHGYDQSSRWGPDYDCSSLVISAYEAAGVPVKTNGATYTGNMKNAFLNTGFIDVTSKITLSSGAGLVAGDVLLHERNHTEMFIGDGKICGAHINENGGITGGLTGDQTGNEISEISYYNYPWEYVLRFPETMTITKADVISANRFLTLNEMKINAAYIWGYLAPRGWSINAVAGMLGNMQTESTINPGIWQSLQSGNYSGGYGLCQWTPATKFTDWCTANGYNIGDIDAALDRIEWELVNNEQYYPTTAYPLTFAEFKVSTDTPYNLAMAFLVNYERPANQNQPKRGTQANYWYEFLQTVDISGGATGPSYPGGTVTPGNNDPIKRKRMSLLLLLAATQRRV